MASVVGTASQYKQFASQTHKNEWEDVLAGLKSNLETEQTALQTTRDYDISGAYANYLQQQRAINQSNALFKSPYQTMAQKQYQSNYATAQSEYASAFNKLQASYISDVTSATTQYDELLTKEAENYKTIYSDLINQLKTSSGIKDDAYLYGIEGGLGYLQETRDEEGNVFVDLTEKGKAALSDYLYGSETRNWDTKDTSKQERYIDYLARTNPEAYEFLISNTENINKNLLQQSEGWSYDKALETLGAKGTQSLVSRQKELKQAEESPYYEVTDKNEIKSKYGEATLKEVFKDKGVDVAKIDTKDTFNISDPNSYNAIKQIDVASGVVKNKAGEYINALRKDAENGKIQVGQYVNFNYGGGDSILGIYLGNGNFTILNQTAKTNRSLGDNNLKEHLRKQIYLPDGFYTTGNGTVKKK